MKKKLAKIFLQYGKDETTETKVMSLEDIAAFREQYREKESRSTVDR